MIFVHECGHFITGKLFGFKVNRIEIYPYGGCSKLEYDINISLWKELLVLVMGPLIQCIFVFIIYNFNIEVEEYFYTYHQFILIFNLLPIYPLDGGKLLNLVFAYVISYYESLKKVIYLSVFLYLILLLSILLWKRNLMIIFILLLLGLKVTKEIKQVDYYFQKFLMERYLNHYTFIKQKNIIDIKQMRRDYYHYFLINKNINSETEVLNSYFS